MPRSFFPADRELFCLSYPTARSETARPLPAARGPKRHARSASRSGARLETARSQRGLFSPAGPTPSAYLSLRPSALSPPDGSFCCSYPSARPKTARPRHDSFSPADSTHSAHLALYHAIIFFARTSGDFVLLILARGPKRHAGSASRSGARPDTARSQRDSFSPAGPRRSAHPSLCPAFFIPAGRELLLCLS